VGRLDRAVHCATCSGPAQAIRPEGSDTLSITIRQATARDVEEAGRIIYAAFKGIAEQHNFPTDFPSVEAATRSARFNIAHEQCYGVAVRSCRYERNPMGTVGVTV